jgi:hypothetical protein
VFVPRHATTSWLASARQNRYRVNRVPGKLRDQCFHRRDVAPERDSRVSVAVKAWIIMYAVVDSSTPRFSNELSVSDSRSASR